MIQPRRALSRLSPAFRDRAQDQAGGLETCGEHVGGRWHRSSAMRGAARPGMTMSRFRRASCTRPIDASTWDDWLPLHRQGGGTDQGRPDGPTRIPAAMRYVRRVLQPGETVVYSAKLHWFVYLWAIFFFIICLVLAGAARSMADKQSVSLALGIAALIFALLALSSALRALVQRATTELAVTDQRVIYKTG